jgi:hypothetical protein
MEQEAYIQIADQDGVIFPNASNNDFLIYTTSASNNIHIGVSNTPAVMVFSASSVDFPSSMSINGNLTMRNYLNIRGLQILRTNSNNATVANVTNLISNVQGLSNDSNGLSLNIIHATETGSMRFLTGAGEAMRVTGDGRVAIGKSNNISASARLDVNGIVNATGLFVNGAPFNGSQWQTNGSNVVLLNSNVGIGRSNPSFTLDVNGIVNATSLYTNGTPYIGSQWTTSTNRIFIIGSNVGIGLNAPTAPLHVRGNLFVDNTASLGITLSNNLGGDGTIGLAHTSGQYSSSALANDLVIRNTRSNNRVFIQSGIQAAGLTVNSNNFIGVNTATPIFPLHVARDSALSNNSLLAGDSNQGQFIISGATNPTKRLAFMYDTNSNIGLIQALTQGGDTNPLCLNAAGGFVGIGTTEPSAPLYVNGINADNVSVFAVGDVTIFSDQRLKTNVEVIQDALGKIDRICGYTFNKVDNPDGKRMAGVLAQEVAPILPEVVSTDPGTGHMSVAYGNMVSLLINGIKELNSEIRTLKEDVQYLKTLTLTLASTPSA